MKILSEIDGEFHVIGFNKNLVICKASKPFKKGCDDLYRVTLSNGESFIGTLHHRVLTLDGYKPLKDLLGSFLCPPLSSMESSLLVHTLNDLRYLKRVRGFLECCFAYLHQYGAQLHLKKAGGLTPDSSPDDALLYNHENLNLDELGSITKYIHSYLSPSLPSNLDAQNQSEDHDVGFLAETAYMLLKQSDGQVQPCLQPIGEFFFQLQSNTEADQHPIYNGNTIYPYTPPLEVTSISWEEKDVYYDFNVPDTNNYYLAGAIHHNSGKTIAGAVEAIRLALGTHPYKKVSVPNNGRIVASLGFEEGAAQVIIPKLYDWLPNNVLKNKPKANQMGIPAKWEFNNGSVFNILSGQQDRKVFEGWTGHWCWVDEPCTRYIYDATRRGLLKNKGDMWFTLTPLAEPWLYNDLYEPWLNNTRDDIDCFTMDMYDNAISNGGYIPDEAIKEFESELPESEVEARIHGKFKFLMGRIYPQFSPETHVCESFDPPRDWLFWEGIDPHLKKEHAYCMWAISPDDEVYVCEEIFEKLTIRELSERIKDIRKGRNVTCTLIDTSSETPDSLTRTTPRRMLEQYGIRTKLAQKKNNVYNGIHIIREWLELRETSTGEKRSQFMVMKHCRRHIKEFLNYVQDDRDSEYLIKDTPRKIWDDMMDLDRYFAVENPLGVRSVKPIRYSKHKYGRIYEEGNNGGKIW